MSEEHVSETDEPRSTNEFPGLPLDVFEAAVEALADLRDDGKYTLFVGRLTSVRLIGEPRQFGPALAERLDRPVHDEEAQTALTEVTNFCRLALSHTESSAVLPFLERNVYRDETEELDDEQKKRFGQMLESKLRIVSERLYSDAVRARARRMETATGPCLEEMDVELVEQRIDQLRGEKIEDPFLRVRLRYSSDNTSVLPFSLFQGPWGSFVPFPLPSFEFECDETDIDLLISRLTHAKTLLTSRDESDSEEE